MAREKWALMFNLSIIGLAVWRDNCWILKFITWESSLVLFLGESFGQLNEPIKYFAQDGLHLDKLIWAEPQKYSL